MNRAQLFRPATFTVLTLLFVLALMANSFAMGGGGDKDPPPDNTRKLKLNPLDESSNTYGWVRITADNLMLGANRVKPDTFYTVYFVNGAEKQAVGEHATVRSTGSGEFKFQSRLTEPLGAKWAKVVMYTHTDNLEPVTESNLQPLMEASLR